MIHSCRDCTDRKVGCHSTCERYLEDKAKHDEMMLQQRKEKEDNRMLSDIKYDYMDKKRKSGHGRKIVIGRR